MACSALAAGRLPSIGGMMHTASQAAESPFDEGRGIENGSVQLIGTATVL
jgi:hypothetical protein